MHEDTDSGAPPSPPPRRIALDHPIRRGEQVIADVTVRKPLSGELRGVKLFDLLQLDVAALQAVLPRLTQPTLTAHDVAMLDPADLLQLGNDVAGFFMPRADRRLLSPSA